MKQDQQETEEELVVPNPKKQKRGDVEEARLETSEIFADPTLDVTFKMLFGNDQHKDVLISLLNSLLGFKGNKEIIEVEINTNELPISVFSSEKGQSGITSSVDILCTNKGKQRIAIEMQGQRTKYFLAREQEYMAKLIAGQVREGEGKLYDQKVLETYIIVIGKANIFLGGTALKDQKLFELDVVPMVVQTNEVVPGNKMHWKFFELPKFQESTNYKKINKDSELKHQWLEFLIDCSKQIEEPDRNEIIKKGYEIMKVAKWDHDTQVLYWKQQANMQDLIETQKSTAEEAFNEGFEKGLEKAKLKGEIKGEISKVKSLIKFKIAEEEIIKDLKFLTHEKVLDKLESNLQYISEHIGDTDSQICEELGLLGDLSDFE